MRFGHTANASTPILAVRVPSAQAVTDNTVLVRWSSLNETPAWLTVGQRTEAVMLNTPLFGHLVPSNTLKRLSDLHWSGLAAAPLFVLGRSGDTITAHALVRLGEHDGLFVRCATLTHPCGSVDAADLLRAVLATTDADREFFNNHQCCYQKFWPDEEFEYKITMLGPVDLHAVTVGLRNLVGSAHLPGTIWDYRDDYQIWDFNNHLFEIVGPPEETGYISFIPDSSGTVIIKRKWFTQDSPRRRETRLRNVAIPVSLSSFEEYIQDHVAGDVRFLGSFRRTRFDSTCEFTRTGNVYGFMVDWCRVLDRPDAPHLYQVEVEYLHSRSRDPNSRAAVEPELATMRDAVAAHLDRVGISHRPGESKLTYLRSLMAVKTP